MKRFNKGTDCGRNLIERSLRELGCGRSVLADSDGNILCGNDVYDTAVRLGKKIVSIETDGDILVVVKRRDMRRGDRKSLEMMLVDDLSQEKNLLWDADAILDEMNRDFSFDARNWGGHSCVVKELDLASLLKDNVQVVAKKDKKKEVDENTSQLRLFD